MDKLPLLEHTCNDTNRLLLYHIQHGDTDKTKFFLYKTAILQGGILQPEGVVFACGDSEWLHSHIVDQGFVAMAPMPEDDPRIIMTYM